MNGILLCGTVMKVYQNKCGMIAVNSERDVVNDSISIQFYFKQFLGCENLKDP